jgi:hypothetical protein
MKKSENRQRTDYAIFRLLPEEKAAFERRCADAGLSKADYFRRKCLEDKPLRKLKSLSVDAQLLTQYLGQIGKIGSNLNQLSKHMNNGFLPADNSLDEALQSIRDMRDILRKALGYDY